MTKRASAYWISGALLLGSLVTAATIAGASKDTAKGAARNAAMQSTGAAQLDTAQMMDFGAIGARGGPTPGTTPTPPREQQQRRRRSR